MLKNLGQFFDYKRFFEGKKLVVSNVTDAVDFESKAVIGRKVELLIMEDRTKYAPSGTGRVSNNFGEKFTVKVLNDTGNAVKMDSLLPQTEVTISGFSKCNIYNDRNGTMQITAEALDIVPVTKSEKK